MKSRSTDRIHLAWTVSLVVHICVAVLVAYMAISVKYQTQQDAIDVSFFKVTPPQAKPRVMMVPEPFVAPTPNLEVPVTQQVEAASRRSVVARPAKSSLSAVPAAPAMAAGTTAPKRRAVNVPGAASLKTQDSQPLSTAADLRVASDTLAPAGLGTASTLNAGLGTSRAEGSGTGTGRGAFGAAGGVSQGYTKNQRGLNSLVEGAGVANIGAALSDVTENIVLGNGVQSLPKGTPGAIIQGRGKDILGRLNLVRLDDPLHPDLDI